MNLPSDVQVHLRDFGRAFPKNVAVTGTTIAPQTLRPGESATITATVFNASPLAIARCPVRLHVESGERKRDLEQTINLEGGATASVTFALETLPEGLWLGHVEASTGDELPFDDRRFLCLRVAPPAQVLIVDGDPGRTPYESETYFLQRSRAARTARRSVMRRRRSIRAWSTSWEVTGLPDLQKTEAVVLRECGQSGRHRTQAAWATSSSRGGGLLVFTGDRVGPCGIGGLEAAGLSVGTVLGPTTLTDLPWGASNGGRSTTRSSSHSPTPEARRPAPAGVHIDHADQTRPGGPSAGAVPG